MSALAWPFLVVGGVVLVAGFNVVGTRDLPEGGATAGWLEGEGTAGSGWLGLTTGVGSL